MGIFLKSNPGLIYDGKSEACILSIFKITFNDRQRGDNRTDLNASIKLVKPQDSLPQDSHVHRDINFMSCHPGKRESLPMPLRYSLC